MSLIGWMKPPALLPEFRQNQRLKWNKSNLNLLQHQWSNQHNLS
jgi:hypothetical protein